VALDPTGRRNGSATGLAAGLADGLVACRGESSATGLCFLRKASASCFLDTGFKIEGNVTQFIICAPGSLFRGVASAPFHEVRGFFPGEEEEQVSKK
jgi:hypothetical protein